MISRKRAGWDWSTIESVEDGIVPAISLTSISLEGID